MDRGVRQAIVQRVTKSWTQLSNWAQDNYYQKKKKKKQKITGVDEDVMKLEYLHATAKSVKQYNPYGK